MVGGVSAAALPGHGAAAQPPPSLLLLRCKANRMFLSVHAIQIALTAALGGTDSGAIHEHEMVRLPNSTYVLFYTGGCGGRCKCPGNFCDQGGLALSVDMKTWRKYAGNPVLPASTVRDRFDSKHRRPRSLNFIGEHWYLEYEGGSHSEIVDHNCSSVDSIGLARSKLVSQSAGWLY